MALPEWPPMDTFDLVNWTDVSTPANGEVASSQLGVGGTFKVFFMAALIFVTFQGNLWVIVAIFHNPSLRYSSSSVFVINLMLVGLLASCLALPLSLAIFSRTPSSSDTGDLTLCDVSDFFNDSFMMCSTLSLSLISIDRFYSIALPMHHAAHASTKPYALIVLAVWFLACGVSTMPVADIAVRLPSLCKRTVDRIDQRYVAIVIFASFFLPSLIIIVMYTGVFCVARKAAHTVLPRPSWSQERLSQRCTTSTVDPLDYHETSHGTGSVVRSPPDKNQNETNSIVSIAISASGPSCVHDNSGGYATSTKTPRVKLVTHPTAKISPGVIRQEIPPPLPNHHYHHHQHQNKPLDPSIFLVSSSLLPPSQKSVSTAGVSSQPTSKTNRKKKRPFTLRLGDSQEESSIEKAERSCRPQRPDHVALKSWNNVMFVCCGSSQQTPREHEFCLRSPDEKTSVFASSSSTTTNTELSTSAGRCLTTEAIIKASKRDGSNRSSAANYNANATPGGHRPSYGKALRTVMVIVVSFFVFWGVYFANAVHLLAHGKTWSYTIHVMSQWLGFTSYAVNPCLYGIMNRQIRQEMRLVLKRLIHRLKICCCCSCWAIYRLLVKPDPSEDPEEGRCSCCAPPRESVDSAPDNSKDGGRGESFFQFLQRTQD